MGQLHIQKEINEKGLQTVLEENNLKYVDYGHKFILKYDQNNSPMEKHLVQESRGLVLNSNTLDVMSLPFKKFFNLGEGNAADIDWDSALIQKKYDGSCISVYYDDVVGNWYAQTTGRAEAEGEVSKSNKTFADLFWKVFNSVSSVSKLEQELIYTFELMTPENVVVTPHTEYKIQLLSVRDKSKMFEGYPNSPRLGELDYSELTTYISPTIGVDYAEVYPMSSLAEVNEAIKDLPYEEEGYVVVDNNFHRVKIKNPEYVLVHYSMDLSYKQIMKVVRMGEIDELRTIVDTELFNQRVDAVERAYNLITSDIIKLTERFVTSFHESTGNRFVGDFDLTIGSDNKELKKAFFSFFGRFEHPLKNAITHQLVYHGSIRDYLHEMPIKYLMRYVRNMNYLELTPQDL